MMESQNRGRIRSLSFTALAIALFGASTAHAQTTSTPALEPATAPASPADATAAPVGLEPAGTATPAPVAAPAATEPKPAVATPDAPASLVVNPPVEPKPEAAAPAPLSEEEESWFYRPSLTSSFGKGEKTLSLTLYGFIQADAMYDTTRSYNDAIGTSLVAPKYTLAGKKGRTQFSTRNTRVGVMLQSPTLGGVKPTAVIEADFFGNQKNDPNPVTSAYTSASENPQSEGAYFNNPAFRLRQAYVKLANDYVDVVAGQTYDVFGWQSHFFPTTVQYLGLPNQIYSRSTQVRLSHNFGESGPVFVEVAASALRPIQRDSGTPDINGGLRFGFNGWKGITTPGNTGTRTEPLSLGVSGVFRQMKPNAFTPPPIQSNGKVQGWGVSIDALIPVIPAKSAVDRSNKLTLTGGFVTGTGIGDLINATGGAAYPTLPNPTQANPAPTYVPNVDPGILSFGTDGKPYTIDWSAVRLGLQYYLPPSGRLIFAANFTQATSSNMKKFFPKGGSEIELMTRVADLSRYADLNLFWDATPSVRFGLSGQYSYVEYLDGNKPHNLRGMGQALYAF